MRPFSYRHGLDHMTERAEDHDTLSGQEDAWLAFVVVERFHHDTLIALPIPARGLVFLL
jgi:hypothetical protein